MSDSRREIKAESSKRLVRERGLAVTVQFAVAPNVTRGRSLAHHLRFLETRQINLSDGRGFDKFAVRDKA